MKRRFARTTQCTLALVLALFLGACSVPWQPRPGGSVPGGGGAGWAAADSWPASQDTLTLRAMEAWHTVDFYDYLFSPDGLELNSTARLSGGYSIEEASLDHTLYLAARHSGNPYDLRLLDANGKILTTIEGVYDYSLNPRTGAVYYLLQRTGRKGLFRWTQKQGEVRLAPNADVFAPAFNDAHVAYCWQGTLFLANAEGVSREVGGIRPGAMLHAVSADGSWIYYTEPSRNGDTRYDSDWVCRGADGAEARLEKAEVGTLFARTFNTSGTEMLASGTNGLWLFKEGGFTRLTTVSTGIMGGPFSYSPSFHNETPSSAGHVLQGARLNIFAQDNFDRFLFIKDLGESYTLCLYWHGQVLQLQSGVQEDPRTSDDFTTVVYRTRAGQLNRVTIQDGDIATQRLLCDDISSSSFELSRDARHLYYLAGKGDGETGTLYHAADGNDPIAIEAQNVLRFATAQNGRLCAFIAGYDPDGLKGTLYLLDTAKTDAAASPEALTDASVLYDIGAQGSIYYSANTAKDGSYTTEELYYWQNGRAHFIDTIRYQLIY